MVSVDSHRVSRAPRYSGIRFESDPFSPTWLSHPMAPLSCGLRLTVRLVTLLLRTLQPLPNPKVKQVWAIPISLATTFGIEFLSFPLGTEMVHFPRFARTRLCIHRAVLRFYRSGFPHSDIPGSKPACGSPRLFAACHVLHRLLPPRHPPCALSSLTIKFTQHTPDCSGPHLANLTVPLLLLIATHPLQMRHTSSYFRHSRKFTQPCDFTQSIQLSNICPRQSPGDSRLGGLSITAQSSLSNLRNPIASSGLLDLAANLKQFAFYFVLQFVNQQIRWSGNAIEFWWS